MVRSKKIPQVCWYFLCKSGSEITHRPWWQGKDWRIRVSVSVWYVC